MDITGGTMTVDPDAIFRLVLTSDVDFTNAFWTQNQQWDVFNASAPGSISSVFQNFEVTGAGLNYSTSLGTFSMTSTGTLQWSAIPEPSTGLAGMLLAAGILRRRRRA